MRFFARPLCCISLKNYKHISYQDPTLRGTCIVPTTQIRASAMLLSACAGNRNARHLKRFYVRNIQCTVVSCYWLMRKVGRNLIWRRELKYDSEYKQKSRTVYVSRKRKRCVCVVYVIHKL
jgi:hypothetical protein